MNTRTVPELLGFTLGLRNEIPQTIPRGQSQMTGLRGRMQLLDQVFCHPDVKQAAERFTSPSLAPTKLPRPQIGIAQPDPHILRPYA